MNFFVIFYFSLLAFFCYHCHSLFPLFVIVASLVFFVIIIIRCFSQDAWPLIVSTHPYWPFLSSILRSFPSISRLLPRCLNNIIIRTLRILTFFQTFLNNILISIPRIPTSLRAFLNNFLISFYSLFFFSFFSQGFSWAQDLMNWMNVSKEFKSFSDLYFHKSVFCFLFFYF